jgi:hypothetical protein
VNRQYAYTYTVLRYVHDTTTGEFVNVGVALYAPEARYVSAVCRTTYRRLNKLFPGVNGEHFRSLMRFIQAQFEGLGERLASELPFVDAKSVLELAQSILPRDDSSLQWSPIGGGRTEDPSQTLDQLFDRMVTLYDEQSQPTHLSDDDVWRSFKRGLEERRVLQHFQPKKVAVQDDEVEFKHAWKNGVWHCLEPISFDLSAAESIREKAHRWLGQMASVKEASQDLKVYLLVGRPRQEELRLAFENALSILSKMPVQNEIVTEEQSGELVNRISNEVAVQLGEQ